MTALEVATKKKKAVTRKLINEAAEIIRAAGVPIDDLSNRRIERMSMCLLGLCEITKPGAWQQTKSLSNERILGTRQIISFMNQYFEESLSHGSYDDIRRRDLLRLTGMGLVVSSARNPEADKNDGTRGYAISDHFSDLIQKFGSSRWQAAVENFEIDTDYVNRIKGNRDIAKLEVTLQEGVSILLDDGPHNQIQKAIIEDFLPNFGYNATILYIGDASEKQMYTYSQKMKDLGLNLKDRGMLPDIVAFSEDKQWLYVIEAVHSSNPLNPERCIELQRTILKNCPYGVVYVTAFLTKKDFSKWLTQIAWETEVWLADNPEHLIHFNGDKFLGPHSSSPKPD